MSALTVSDVDVPDLLGTAPADLIDRRAEQPPASADTARQRAERIRADLHAYTRMRQDIADAFAQRDWAALGYDSWFGYLEGEFGEQLQQLARDREQRPAAVQDLRAQGLSTRQIAAVVDVDAKTVRNDLAGQVGNDSPPDGKIVGSDGKSYPARRATRTGAALSPEALIQWLTTTVSPLGDFARTTGAMRNPHAALSLSSAEVTGVLDLPEPGSGPVAGVVLHTVSRNALTIGPFGDAAAAHAWWTVPFNRHGKNANMAFVLLPLPDARPDPVDSPAGPAVASTTPGGDGGDSRLQDRPGPDAPERVRKAGHDDAGPVPPAAQDTTQRLDAPAGGTATPAPAAADPARPIVLVASPVPGQPPARAEVWDDNGGGTTVKVVYCDSRTGAQVARRRILGPADTPADPDEVGTDFGVIQAGFRDLRVRGVRLPDSDLPVALLAVEADGQEKELVALNALKVELLITRLQAVHRWLVTA